MDADVFATEDKDLVDAPTRKLVQAIDLDVVGMSGSLFAGRQDRVCSVRRPVHCRFRVEVSTTSRASSTFAAPSL